LSDDGAHKWLCYSCGSSATVAYLAQQFASTCRCLPLRITSSFNLLLPLASLHFARLLFYTLDNVKSTLLFNSTILSSRPLSAARSIVPRSGVGKGSGEEKIKFFSPLAGRPQLSDQLLNTLQNTARSVTNARTSMFLWPDCFRPKCEWRPLLVFCAILKHEREEATAATVHEKMLPVCSCMPQCLVPQLALAVYLDV
jgi:hypothetical protein